jgi:hypothetical protein
VRALAPYPSGDAVDREAARVVAGHPEQAWSMPCNDVVLFDGTGVLLPSGRMLPLRLRATPRRAVQHESRWSCDALHSDPQAVDHLTRPALELRTPAGGMLPY